eukprot:CAMPEP_0185593512 /NCGR_PEP_ID=MMETSP0434-20130131/71719_1 /TAXON_ID=626734 ORGANISM="Favella taraikaensis, Strain Fe Narragansett Bay" /NCGR_SAMPLE_ID=MMETSP0434 /ASSEMBLY_ACC=CAM_ASM_000379 /LENGTH=65 /DNA_ID=CAMNT_0028220139 /DNA_START=770 /DNA_END=967 /DNA_ORIENTATION=-
MRKDCCQIRYTAVFTDIQMPVLDGIEASRVMFALEKKLRASNPALPKLTIAAVSAYNDQETKTKC